LFFVNFIHQLSCEFFFFSAIYWYIPFQIRCSVFKFVEQPENNEKLSDQKNKVKFKIMSLKVKEGVDYVPELVCLVLLMYIVCMRDREGDSISCLFCWLIC
jgi:hypothetical protein